MFGDDWDFSGISGDWADSNSDGAVDIEEFLNDDFDFRHVMGIDDSDSDDEDGDEFYNYDEDDDDEDDDEDDDNAPRCQITQKTIKAHAVSSSSTEDRYYDRDNRIYLIGEAMYDSFPEISESFERYECEGYADILHKIYSVNHELAIKIWLWILKEFPKALVNDGVDYYDSQAWEITDGMLHWLNEIDSDDDYIFEFISKRPELEDIIFAKSFIDDNITSHTDYLPYCIDKNMQTNFEHVYRGIINNPFREETKLSTYKILEDILMFANIHGIQEADPWFYSFLEKEIVALKKPLKEKYLMQLLNKEEYGERIFSQNK